MKFIKNQRGAMFGLDARVAAAIFAGLAVISGTAITTTVLDGRAHRILEDSQKTKEAVTSIMYDLRGSLHESLSTQTNDSDAYMSLLSDSPLNAAGRRRWIGPYLGGLTTEDAEYGERLLDRGTETSPTTSCNSNCMVWLTYADVMDVSVAQRVNSLLDGDNETDPSNEGDVQWSTPSGSVRLHIKLNREP